MWWRKVAAEKDEGHIRRNLCVSEGAAATGIWKMWQGESEGRRSRALKATDEGGAGEVDRNERTLGGADDPRTGQGFCTGGRMILCGNRTDVGGWGDGPGVFCPFRTDIRRQE